MNRSAFSVSHGTQDEHIIRVKQKLAQAIANLGKKDAVIEECKAETIKVREQVKILEAQVAELKEAASENEQRMIEQKVAYSSI
jgi:hypothetical protein